jgi:hypothetical protein
VAIIYIYAMYVLMQTLVLKVGNLPTNNLFWWPFQ